MVKNFVYVIAILNKDYTDSRITGLNTDVASPSRESIPTYEDGSAQSFNPLILVQDKAHKSLCIQNDRCIPTSAHDYDFCVG